MQQKIGRVNAFDFTKYFNIARDLDAIDYTNYTTLSFNFTLKITLKFLSQSRFSFRCWKSAALSSEGPQLDRMEEVCVALNAPGASWRGVRENPDLKGGRPQHLV